MDAKVQIYLILLKLMILIILIRQINTQNLPQAHSQDKTPMLRI